MCRKLKKQTKEEKMKLPAHSVVYTSANVQNGIEESFQLEEPTCKVQIDNGAIDHSETFDPNSFQISNSSRCL